MKNLRKLSGLALALLGGAPFAARAQTVTVPATPVPTAVAAPAPAAVVSPTRNLWTFLCLSPEQKAACKAKFCASQFGRLINNSLAPASVFTGSVIPQCCPLIDPANLAQPPDSALGAAAQIQKDTAEAAARRAAIRYMSTVDCNWWPEASAALINSLRADKNECVRLEAALALQRGCCCNRDTVKALVNTLSVFPDDGNPGEDSPRVRAAATGALQHCLACYVAIAPPPPLPPPTPLAPPKEELPPGERSPVKVLPLVPAPPAVPTPVPPGMAPVAGAQRFVRPATYHAPVQERTMEQVVQEARLVLQQTVQQQALQQRRIAVGSYQSGGRCLFGVIENALHPPTPQPAKSARLTSPPQAAALQQNTVEPPATVPAPRFPPPMSSPRPRTIPAEIRPPLVEPVPPSPVSLDQSRPSALPFTPANPSYAASVTPVFSVPSQPLPPPVYSTMTPAVVGDSTWPASPKPAEPYVSTTVPPLLPTTVNSSRLGAAPSTSTYSSYAEPMTVHQALRDLKDALGPSQREMAAEQLSELDWRERPYIVECLTRAAKEDPAASVRAACVHALAHLEANTTKVVAAVRDLKNDGDPHVRQEAEEALFIFGLISDSGMQQTSHH